MYKNQLQELAQRSCFKLPSYTCIREGPDHAPRFKAVVDFNGESFESPHYCSNLRQAEHAAAEAALVSLSSAHSLAARVLDETGVYKNLLQEIAQRVGSPLPYYSTFRSGFGHLPIFTGTVELAGITFRGEPAKNKKQAEKNAALSAWLSLKQLAQQDLDSSSEHKNNNDEQEQIRIARALQNYRLKLNTQTSTSNAVSLPPFQKAFSPSTSSHRPSISTSKILPMFSQQTASRNRPQPTINEPSNRPPSPEIRTTHTQRIPYIPINQCKQKPYNLGRAPPVTLRTSVPVFSAQPRPMLPSQVMQPQPTRVAPPVRVRQAVSPVSVAPREGPPGAVGDGACDVDESTAIKCLEQLEII